MPLDLNLARVLEAVMLERNVTRAASLLVMSQPAVSNALRRARHITQDELFTKVAGGVEPTSRMLSIWPDLQQSLMTIRGLIAPDRFDPKTDVTTFRVAVTDSLAEVAVPRLTLALSNAAPKARVKFSIHNNALSLNGIERGTLDCAVGMFPTLPHTIKANPIINDCYICVMRAGHPLARRMTIDQFLSARHVLVTPSGLGAGIIDTWLGVEGHVRNIFAVVNHFAEALRIVADSDLLTCVPKLFLNGSGRDPTWERNVIARRLPFDTHDLLYKLAWHERTNGDAAHQWFRSLVVAACNGTDLEPPSTMPSHAHSRFAVPQHATPVAADL